MAEVTPPRILLDEYSLSTLFVEMFFQKTLLATCTAFIWQADRNYLITNWHNVTGKSPFTGKHISDNAGEPDRMRVYFHTPGLASLDRHMIFFNLRAPDGAPNWFVHPRHRRLVDVVAVPIDVPRQAVANPINKMRSSPLELRVGMDVFVLGYPLGIGAIGLPVWKRASYASEPTAILDQQLYSLLDTASRPGMSGSPVVRRSWGMHLMEGNSITGSQDETRFVGVYSGRVGLNDGELQLGLMWPARFVAEIVSGNTRDDIP